VTLFVVGNITEDIVFGLPRLPSDGETLIADSRVSDIGGKGLNQALIAGRCGMKVRLIAPIGRDEPGRRARTLVAAEPIEAALIEKEEPTDQSIIAVARNGDNHIISSAFAASALTQADVAAAARDAGPGDQVLMQGNLSLKTTHEVLEWARAAGARTTVNPSPIRWGYDLLWPLIDRVILNLHELEELSGRSDLDAGIDMLHACGVGEVLVTRGAQGALFSSGDLRHAVAAAPSRVIDTAGAGDTFCGVFVAARDRGADCPAAMGAAARAAAITIARSGTWSAFPSVEDLARLLAPTEARD